MSLCIACSGSKHRFVEVKLPQYNGITTRIYLGRCMLCNKGRIEQKQDKKQTAAGS